MKKDLLSFLLLLTVSFFSFPAKSQLVTVLDPNGGGGFELGNSFAANGWTAVQPGNARQWLSLIHI